MSHAPEVIKKLLAEHNISESLWYDVHIARGFLLIQGI